jgi:Aldo/keto reductases, related to diketogulonate reductase
LSAMRTLQLPSGENIPVLGQGTWNLGDNPRSRKEEIATLCLGIDFGMTLIDTAEMYGSGASEQLVGEAIAGRRDDVFLVSKVLPSNATRRGTITACERSLRHLRTDHLDLYLLHWRGGIPLAETLEAFTTLVQEGKIRYWGVSNFDIADMQELVGVAGGSSVALNQVLYNLTRRGIEYDLLPWSREHGIPVMAYSPIEQGRMLSNAGLREIAERHGATPAQVGLAWLLRQDGLCAIPKASTVAHVRENWAALDLQLTEQDLVHLDRIFPAPTRHRPLEML